MCFRRIGRLKRLEEKTPEVFLFFFYLPIYTINYFVATAEDGAAAPDFLGLGCVPSRKPFLKKKAKISYFTVIFGKDSMHPFLSFWPSGFRGDL